MDKWVLILLIVLLVFCFIAITATIVYSTADACKDHKAGDPNVEAHKILGKLHGVKLKKEVQDEEMSYNGQARQDMFVDNVLGSARGRHFLEIGSNHYKVINNTYFLEHTRGWSGIMVEQNGTFLPGYKEHRPNSSYIIGDGTTADYASLMRSLEWPRDLGYLQVDLESNPTGGSSLTALRHLDRTILSSYRFAVVTFEHDAYHAGLTARNESRDIFNKHGYVRVFSDVNHTGVYPYEDWYVHPDLVDMEYVRRLIQANANHYKEISSNEGNSGCTNKAYVRLNPESINWQDIVYPDRT